jgi:hypothetical protein
MSYLNFSGARMTRSKLLIPAVSLIFLFGCASRQKTDTDQSSTPPASGSTQSASKSKEAPAAERTDGRKVKSKDGKVDGEIFGTLVPGSKFSKLEIGMSKAAVEKLIGSPDDQDSHITGRQFTPFYFGGDTQRVEAFYKYEGQLTYSNNSRYSVPDTLITIAVDRKATGKHQ